jgi:hypothetical protein
MLNPHSTQRFAFEGNLSDEAIFDDRTAAIASFPVHFDRPLHLHGCHAGFRFSGLSIRSQDFEQIKYDLGCTFTEHRSSPRG